MDEENIRLQTEILNVQMQILEQMRLNQPIGSTKPSSTGGAGGDAAIPTARSLRELGNASDETEKHLNELGLSSKNLTRHNWC
jgi:hypothetical protein